MAACQFHNQVGFFQGNGAKNHAFQSALEQVFRAFC